MKTAEERFSDLHNKLKESGRLFTCELCGNERDRFGCLECEEMEYILEKRHKEQKESKPENRGTAARLSDYRETYRITGNHRAAIRSYCRGNKWLEENAKAVGNW
jgi:predicted ATP-dependent serine protease